MAALLQDMKCSGHTCIPFDLSVMALEAFINNEIKLLIYHSAMVRCNKYHASFHMLANLTIRTITCSLKTEEHRVSLMLK